MATPRTALAAVVGAAVLAVGSAESAHADPPVEFDVPVHFDDVNPCTGDANTVSILFSVDLHQHRNNSVLNVDSTITTSDGFAGKGHETQAITRNGVMHANFNHMLFHEDGRQYAVHGRAVVDVTTDTVLAESFRLECIRHG